MILFDEIMQNCPYLRDLIQDKITEEIGKKDVEILALTEVLTATQDELALAKERVTGTESAINMILEVM